MPVLWSGVLRVIILVSLVSVGIVVTGRCCPLLAEALKIFRLLYPLNLLRWPGGWPLGWNGGGSSTGSPGWWPVHPVHDSRLSLVAGVVMDYGVPRVVGRYHGGLGQWSTRQEGLFKACCRIGDATSRLWLYYLLWLGLMVVKRRNAGWLNMKR